MKISGFTFCRNAPMLAYPFIESIQSALPLVDEFIVAVAHGDEGDTTLQDIEAIGSEKIKIVDTDWKADEFRGGTEYARQTDIARFECTGDWLLYLQADEVLHEADIPILHKRCSDLLHNHHIEGMIMQYFHFWGDYNHYHTSHAWYPYEIRVIRNHPDIHSWMDAQSFRKIPDFNPLMYGEHQGTHKLHVADSGARIFHYGYVRPPDYMQRKNTSMREQYHGATAKPATEMYQYGNLSKIPEYKGSHPAIMQKRISEMDWTYLLNYDGKEILRRPLLKHEKLKYRIISGIEQKLLCGRHVGAFKNYIFHNIP